MKHKTFNGKKHYVFFHKQSKTKGTFNFVAASDPVEAEQKYHKQVKELGQSIKKGEFWTLEVPSLEWLVEQDLNKLNKI